MTNTMKRVQELLALEEPCLLNGWSLKFLKQDQCEERNTVGGKLRWRHAGCVVGEKRVHGGRFYEGDHCVTQSVSRRGPELGMDERNRKMTGNTWRHWMRVIAIERMW